MPENKGKPSGKDSETKTGIGRKRDYQRTGWPEDAPTQRSEPGAGVEGIKSRTALSSAQNPVALHIKRRGCSSETSIGRHGAKLMRCNAQGPSRASAFKCCGVE